MIFTDEIKEQMKKDGIPADLVDKYDKVVAKDFSKRTGYTAIIGKPLNIQRVEGFNGKVFFKIRATKRRGEETEVATKLITFACEPPKDDKFTIFIKKGYEDFYYARDDVKKYNPIWTYRICEYTLVAEHDTERSAISQYKKELNSSIEQPIDWNAETLTDLGEETPFFDF